MKKFAKMSLVAAIAVAGMTSANAKDLTEAIKDVDVSGTVVYRYNDYSNADTADKSVNSNNYQIAINASVKVNDDVTLNTRFRTDEVSLDSRKDGDSNPSIKLSEVNFTYTGVKNLSVTLGKQGINTPWTVGRDSLGEDQTGTGVVAAYTAGPATLVGAYFNQTNFNVENSKFDGANDIYVIGAMASFAGVNLDAFYADLDRTFDSYTLGVDASYNIGAVALSPFARFTSLSPKNETLGTSKDQELWQIGMGASMGMFNAFVAYGEAGKDGGLVYIDGSAQTNMDYHWRVTADGSADTEYLYAHVDADVTEKVNVGLFYSEADYKEANKDYNEIYVQAKYKMSSNLMTYVRLGQLDSDANNDDQEMGRLHVQYSF